MGYTDPGTGAWREGNPAVSQYNPGTGSYRGSFAPPIPTAKATGVAKGSLASLYSAAGGYDAATLQRIKSLADSFYGSQSTDTATQSEHGTPGFAAPQLADEDEQALNKFIQQGIVAPPKDGGLTWGFKDAFLNPAVLAAVGGAAFAGAGGASSGAGLTADQALAQSAAGLSETGLSETAFQLGAGQASALGTAGGVATGGGAGGTGAAQPGAATGTTGTVAGTTAAPAAAAPGGTTAATALQMAKDYGGIALTLGGLLGGGGQEAKAPDVGAAEAPPQSQAARQPDELARRKANPMGGQDTLLTGASGIDPFSLNLGRNKLLGQ